MGEIVWQPGNRVYLDTNLFIYAVEEIVPYADQVKPLTYWSQPIGSCLHVPHLGCLWRNSTPLSWSGQPDCAPRRTVCACPMPFTWQPQHWNDATVF